ncbi:MAG: hypothetical protein M0Z95_04940, partial [Actinomycetota bacterium]|nr:hypothetical protein [Actinomycetota bacterium]
MERTVRLRSDEALARELATPLGYDEADLALAVAVGHCGAEQADRAVEARPDRGGRLLGGDPVAEGARLAARRAAAGADR